MQRKIKRPHVPCSSKQTLLYLVFCVVFSFFIDRSFGFLEHFRICYNIKYAYHFFQIKYLPFVLLFLIHFTVDQYQLARNLIVLYHFGPIPAVCFFLNSFHHYPINKNAVSQTQRLYFIFLKKSFLKTNTLQVIIRILYVLNVQLTDNKTKTKHYRNKF